MGIPHLIGTLEPYASHELLQDDTVVVDGPALAYHIFYVCRNNGVNQPSYGLLGQFVVAWLDRLVDNGIVIEAIYFDGYLPVEKLPVRMERAAKTTSLLTYFHSSNLSGCPSDDISAGTDTPVDPFEQRRPAKKGLQPPAFLVPAIIDALRQCARYQGLVRLVPGEADAYCAQHLSNRGGLVLTSDSDLLAHDLGTGRVTFLKDVYVDSSKRLACAMFNPRRIAQSLGLASPTHLCRLAYERKSAPQATLPQIQRACSNPILDEGDYQEFCRQYLHHESSSLPVSIGGHTLSLGGLDPRISELVLQLGQSHSDSEQFGDDARFFLPHLLDSPARGSAWEQSLPIRELAYTIARWIIPGTSSSVKEYRRVQSVQQKGRQVDMMSQDAGHEQIDGLLHTMTRLTGLTPQREDLYWMLLFLILDIQMCEAQDKQSHVLHTLRSLPPNKSPKLSRVSWDLIHFAAQLQASYYSLRILKQTLTLTTEVDADLLPPSLPQLRDALLSLPPLSESPQIDDTLRILRRVDHFRIMEVLKEFVRVPDTRAQKSSDSSRVEKRKNKKKKRKPSDTVAKGAASANMFDLLSADQ